MHHLYFVLIEKDQAKSSFEARKKATFDLNHNEFAESESFFTFTKADWFVVGGRWSGVLSFKHYAHIQAVKKALVEAGVVLSPFGFADKDVKAHSELIQKLWDKIGGNQPSPLLRDSYKSLGYEDDAKLFDEQLLSSLTERFPAPQTQKDRMFQPEIFIPSQSEEMTISEFLESPSEYLDKYWLVVVDYHN